MAESCNINKQNKATNTNKVEEVSAGDNQYRDEVVMKSEGAIAPDSEGYVESDDEMNAIAQGWK